MPYSPSLFFSSYSFGIALFEHGVPYALIPFLQFSLPNFLANALGEHEAPHALFLSVADLSATDYGIAVECSLSVCLSVCVDVSTIKIL